VETRICPAASPEIPSKGEGGTVAAQANLPAVARIGYSVAGLALIYAGFTAVESDVLRYFLPLVGGFVLVEGIIEIGRAHV